MREPKYDKCEGKKTLPPVAGHLPAFGVWWYRANTFDDHSGSYHFTNDSIHRDRRRNRNDGSYRRRPAYRKSDGVSLDLYGGS